MCAVPHAQPGRTSPRPPVLTGRLLDASCRMTACSYITNYVRMDAMIPDGVLFLIAVSAIPQDTNLKYEVRAIVIYIYREEEYVLVQYTTYLCTQKSSGRMFVTWSAAQFGELNTGLAAIRSFVSLNRRNARRRRHSLPYYAIDLIVCGALHRSRA